MQIIMRQIALRNIQPLIEGILKWPLIEIQLLLSEIIACLHWVPYVLPQYKRTAYLHAPARSGFDEQSALHITAREAYVSSTPSGSHSALPVIEFLSGLVVSGGEMAGTALVDAGFLDMLMIMAILRFPDPTPRDRSSRTRQSCQAKLMEACEATLLHVASAPLLRTVIAQHMLSVFWPRARWLQLPEYFPRYPAEKQDQLRRKIIGHLKENLLQRRLVVIDELLECLSFSGASDDCAHLACVDLLQLCVNQ